LEPTVIEFCDRSRSLSQIVDHIRAAAGNGAADESWLRPFLARMLRCRLLIEQDGRYLSLIMP
jgi:hypothetical protein